MVKRIAPIGVISFFLLAACGALCQSELPSADLLAWDGSNSPQGWREKTLRGRLLPDAPSVQPTTQAEKLHSFVNEAGSSLALGARGINAGVIRETELGHFNPGPQPSLTASYKAAVFPQKESNMFFDKYLYPSLLKHGLRYPLSTSSSFLGRATYAASRIFFTRDASGKGRLNTSYFLGVLTSVAVDTAYRPYWARSASATFNNFGSTIGSGAGINLLREFGPGIRQIVRGHTPKFASRIEERVIH